MSKVILFVRVSTLQQHLESQEDALRRAAIADGYSEDDIIVIGKKESAIKLDEEEREGLIELKNILAKESIDCIYIFELSRLSRRPMILYSLREQLLQARVQLKCLKPQFTLLTPDRSQYDNMASLVFSLFGAMAEQEMIEKKERFHRGKRRLAEEGRYNGGNIPFGYTIDRERNNLIVINEQEAAIVKEVFNLYENGISQPQLAREFYRRGITQLTMSFINNILNNRRYTGDKHCYEGSSFERTYPVIITPEQFENCRRIAKENNTRADKARNVYYAKRLIVCKECGRFWSSSGSKVLYHCYDAFNVNRKYDRFTTPQCKCRIGISINIMDSILWFVAQEAEVNYILTAASEDREIYQNKIEIIDQKLAFINTRLEELDKKRTRIVDSYIDGDISKEKRDERFASLDRERKDILLDQLSFQNERQHLEILLDDLHNNYGFDNVDAMVNLLEQNIELRNNISQIRDDEERSRIVHRHVKKVQLENKKILYKFGIGERLALSRFISIELYTGAILYFHYIPNAGNGGIVLKADEQGNMIEKISMEYLDRFYDEGKRRRNRERREKNKREREEKYPSDKYILGYSSLAKFLGVGLSTAHRWVEKLGILKDAVVDRYKKEVVVDKQKCLELLNEEAKNNVWVQKSLKIVKNG